MTQERTAGCLRRETKTGSSAPRHKNTSADHQSRMPKLGWHEICLGRRVPGRHRFQIHRSSISHALSPPVRPQGKFPPPRVPSWVGKSSLASADKRIEYHFTDLNGWHGFGMLLETPKMRGERDAAKYTVVLLPPPGGARLAGGFDSRANKRRTENQYSKH
jgi:hypothetical protein